MSGTKLLEVGIGRGFGGSGGVNYSLYNWKPVSGTKLLEVNMGRGFGGSGEVNYRLYNWKPAYENTRRCGELKLYFSPSAGG